MKDNAITVSEFNSLINQTLEFAYPEVVIEGEVANYKLNQGKWVFFDLKDDESLVSCFITAYQLKSVIEDGMMIRVKAVPKLTKWGKFSITVREIELAGEGSVKRAFELLKAKFEKEGFFSEDRKRQLPKIPEKIALITSSQAAAYNDFINIINDRWSGLDIDHIQVQVQGASAASQISSAIDYVNQSGDKYDAVVVIRGGGSPEDLQAFNEEEVVRAVYASSIPTLVGIGHEDDVSLAELAADLRASTPSDAARRLVPDKSEFMGFVSSLLYKIKSIVESTISENNSLLNSFYYSFELNISRMQQDLAETHSRMFSFMDIIISNSKSKLQYQSNLLNSLNPESILARGYSIARVNDKVIKSASQYRTGDKIVLQLHQGKLELSPVNKGVKRDEKQQTEIDF